MILERQIEVQNLSGLHARPAACITKLLKKSRSKVIFTYNKKTADASSVMHILLLEAGCGARINVRAEGDDAEAVLSALEKAFAGHFGEVSV